MATNGPGGSGQQFSGIDPQQLGDMIQSVSTRTSNAQALVNGWIAEMNRCGLDTSQLRRAAQDLAWAQAQLPMLKRRQQLTVAAAQQGVAPGMNTAGAGNLDFATAAAATAAGKTAGAKAKLALANSQDVNFIADALAQHAGDPSYLAAFFQALGPQELTRLGMHVNSLGSPQRQAWSKLVGGALATASYQMPLTQQWLQQADPTGRGTGPDLPDLAPFLSQGVYSAAWLGTLGGYALDAVRGSAGTAQPPRLDSVWGALARNPAAAARFYHDNFGKVSTVMTGPLLLRADDTAFAGFAKAATIAPKGADPKAFAANAERTVKYFGSDASLRTSGPVRQTMAAIAMSYFSNLSASIRAAAPGIGLPLGKKPALDMPGWQVTASSADWGDFVEEAMRDKTAAAQLMTFYSTWRYNQPRDDYGPGTDNVPLEQGYWRDTSLGVLDDFMAYRYTQAGATAGTSSAAIADVATSGGAAFLTTLLFPEDAPASAFAALIAASKAGGRDAFKSAAESNLKDVFGSAPAVQGEPAILYRTWPASTIRGRRQSSSGITRPGAALTRVTNQLSTWVSPPTLTLHTTKRSMADTSSWAAKFLLLRKLQITRRPWRHSMLGCRIPQS